MRGPAETDRVAETSLSGELEGWSVEELKVALERARHTNLLLREENDWLRDEVIRLNQSLYEANRDIYSLKRKLDAIFKTDSMAK